ncbi:MAG: ATP-binding protein [Phycisphaerae bacterium]
MANRRGSKNTLERRGRLLFALFILLTVVACLSWPWWQMGRLARSGDPDLARAKSQAYLQNLHAVRFAADKKSAEQLKRFGANGEGEPKLVRLAPPTPAQPQTVPAGVGEFETEAIREFLKHPEGNQYFREAGDTFRYVRALRAGTGCLGCHSNYQAGDLMGAVVLKLDVGERNKGLLANRLVLTLAALLVVAISVAVFYALFRYMVVRPVRHLKTVADRVSEGDLQVRSEIDTADELEALSDAMNHMLDRLAETQSELREATAVRDAKLDELASANVALFEMNQVKNKFLTTMSHELRTPLNSIIGFAQVLSESEAAAQDPKLGRYARNILTSGRALLEMINDLLDLAKIEAGRIQVRCEEVSIPQVAEAVCGMVRPLLAEKQLKLTHEVDPATPLMITDGAKVQQILHNLLSNAIKFTEEGEVRLTVRPAEDERVAFIVSDTGPGITKEQQLRIFERFTQLDSSHTRQYRGTGLGLSIVKDLAGLLDGEVSVESEPGQGATFTVVLPVDSRDAEGRTPEKEKAPGAAAKPASEVL